MEKSSDVDVDVKSPIEDRRTELGGEIGLDVTEPAMVHTDIVDQKILGRARGDDDVQGHLIAGTREI
ncbi:hypothetical protein KIN20_035761 [Parelaphostrongylus tenuis]|uniref:Uncharacterized protein n=1 Tax=Parelaphostrongylus tenuis TaxID=148309 RepID=A0AAD5RC68_PARTN|nr:hypothetical protein KIN20_035761 [Parelaphostrongylus tenuis]